MILHEYLDILTDPAHGLAEVTFTVLVDVLGVGLLWPLVRRLIRREHTIIDAEHGVEHPIEHDETGGKGNGN